MVKAYHTKSVCDPSRALSPSPPPGRVWSRPVSLIYYIYLTQAKKIHMYVCTVLSLVQWGGNPDPVGSSRSYLPDSDILLDPISSRFFAGFESGTFTGGSGLTLVSYSFFKFNRTKMRKTISVWSKMLNVHAKCSAGWWSNWEVYFIWSDPDIVLPQWLKPDVVQNGPDYQVLAPVPCTWVLNAQALQSICGLFFTRKTTIFSRIDTGSCASIARGGRLCRLMNNQLKCIWFALAVNGLCFFTGKNTNVHRF